MRKSAAGFTLLLGAFSAVSATAMAQSPYSLIGTSEQGGGPVVWPAAAGKGEAFGEIMKAWAVEDGFSGTVIAAFDGKIAYRGAFGFADYDKSQAMALDTPMRAGFLSRYFSAVAVMLLADEGAVSEDAPIGDYLEGLREDIASIPVRDFLAQKSGLDQNIFKHTEISFSSDIGERSSLIALVNRVERIGASGENFRGFGPDGSSVDYILLGLMIESVTGEKFEKVIRSRILEPLTLEHTGFLTENYPAGLARTHHELFSAKKPYEAPHPSYTFASGAIYSTADDLSSFIQSVFIEGFLGERAREVFTAYEPRFEFAVDAGEAFSGENIPDSAARYWTIGDNGWMRGETILYQHILPDNDMLIVLSNIHRASEIYDMRRRFARLKFDLPVGAPLPKVRKKLWEILRSDGAGAAHKYFASIQAGGKGADLPWPDQFMHHSRELRAHSRFDEAVLVTELYILTQPDFYLPYREMGEIYRLMGKQQRAAHYFKMALARNPDDPIWAREMEEFVKAYDK